MVAKKGLDMQLLNALAFFIFPPAVINFLWSATIDSVVRS